MEKVPLPDGREIYYNYEAGTQFKNLGRVANIADCDSDDPADANTYAAYSYLGASMILEANHVSLSRRAGAVPPDLGPDDGRHPPGFSQQITKETRKAPRTLAAANRSSGGEGNPHENLYRAPGYAREEEINSMVSPDFRGVA